MTVTDIATMIAVAITRIVLEDEAPSRDGVVDMLVEASVVGLFSNLIPVNMLCGNSSMPLLSTLQYPKVLLVPSVVICGCPSVATLLTDPPLIL